MYFPGTWLYYDASAEKAQGKIDQVPSNPSSYIFIN